MDVHRALHSHLNSCFCTSRDVPISQGKLLKDLGHLADTSAATSILKGTYIFPLGTDKATVEVLKAAAEIYSRNKGVVDILLTHKDFQWWRTAQERTKSARSGLLFGHSVTQTLSLYLTRLKVIQLNIVLKMGASLDCWLNGLTIMLEKEKGKINIKRLRAICLFEADLNWVLKIVYAKRMMRNAREQDLILPELFATAGRSAIDATKAKIMFTDV